MKYEMAVKSTKMLVAHAPTPTPYVIYKVRNGQWMNCSKAYADESGIKYLEENVFWFHDMLNKFNWWKEKKNG